MSGGLWGLVVTAALADCFQESEKLRQGRRFWKGHQLLLCQDPGSRGAPREEFGETAFRICGFSFIPLPWFPLLA